jgi:hypothetical protein
LNYLGFSVARKLEKCSDEGSTFNKLLRAKSLRADIRPAKAGFSDRAASRNPDKPESDSIGFRGDRRCLILQM